MKLKEYLKVGKVGDIINGGFGNEKVEEIDLHNQCIVVRKVAPNYAPSSKWNNLCWELLVVKNNMNNMNIQENFILAFKSEPEKTFRKTGITNGDDVLTDDGQKIFLSWLLKKNQDEFKKEVADNILKDIENEKK